MEVAYHLCGALLEKGSVILPGSYGHIVQNVYGHSPHYKLGNPQVLFYEERLEAFRKQHAPEKPSRFNCVFVCHSRENLENFIQYSARHFQFGYQVEILGDMSNAHYADWQLYDNKWTEQNDWKSAMDKSIFDYWKEDRRSYLADNAKPLEILVSHKVRVLERVI